MSALEKVCWEFLFITLHMRAQEMQLKGQRPT